MSENIFDSLRKLAERWRRTAGPEKKPPTGTIDMDAGYEAALRYAADDLEALIAGFDKTHFEITLQLAEDIVKKKKFYATEQQLHGLAWWLVFLERERAAKARLCQQCGAPPEDFCGCCNQ